MQMVPIASIVNSLQATPRYYPTPFKGPGSSVHKAEKRLSNSDTYSDHGIAGG